MLLLHLSKGILVKYRLLQWLSCPSCGGHELNLEVISQCETPVYSSHQRYNTTSGANEDTAPESELEVEEGALQCTSCGLIYPIRQGILRKDNLFHGKTQQLENRHLLRLLI